MHMVPRAQHRHHWHRELNPHEQRWDQILWLPKGHSAIELGCTEGGPSATWDTILLQRSIQQADHILCVCAGWAFAYGDSSHCDADGNCTKSGKLCSAALSRTACVRLSAEPCFQGLCLFVNPAFMLWLDV